VQTFGTLENYKHCTPPERGADVDCEARKQMFAVGADDSAESNFLSRYFSKLTYTGTPLTGTPKGVRNLVRVPKL